MHPVQSLLRYLRKAKALNWTLPGFKVLAQEYGVTEDIVKAAFNKVFHAHHSSRTAR